MLRWLLVLPIASLAAAGVWIQGGAGGKGGTESGEIAGAVARVSAPTEEGQTLTLQGVARVEPAAGEETAPDDVATDEGADEVFEEAFECVTRPPPDPVEAGTCTLIASVTDEAGAAPTEIDLELWRLGAPANEHWRAGDQLQAKAEVTQGRVEWSGLPEGRYRLFSPDLRPTGEDPQAFEVAGALTMVSVAVPMPRRVPVLVQVVDENGRPIHAGEECTLGGSTHGTDAHPKWLVARRLHRGMLGASGFSCCGCGGGTDEGRPIVATETGFELGPCSESSRARSHSWTGELSFEGRTSVTAFVSSNEVRVPHATRYVAVSVPLAQVAACIWTSEGRLALDSDATFDATCRAVRVAEGEAAPDPNRLPIVVHVTLAGHEPLTFTTRPGARPVERTLRRSADSDSR
jgi:hypothetical protein